MDLSDTTVYEMVGGAPTFRALAAEFYRRVETEPILRALYPRSTRCARESLEMFLAEFFGGPDAYSDWRGYPRLRRSHQRFRIGAQERNAWLRIMSESMDAVGIRDPARAAMQDFFVAASAHLVNATP